jgi:hypothetical protein
MSPIQCPPLPSDTAHSAESIFGRDHPYLKIGQSLAALWGELELAELRAADAFLADAFFPYALATILQYWEALSNRQMSQATRTRLDLKYALHLPLNSPGVEPLMLCAFRQHILASQPGQERLQEMIDRLATFASPEKSRLKVDQIISGVCLPNRADIILECMGVALEAAATYDPQWLKVNTQPHWYGRYQPRFDSWKLSCNPGEIEGMLVAVGEDGRQLLQSIENTQGSDLARLPEILMLRREWKRQFEARDGTMRLRASCCLLCGMPSGSALRNNQEGKEQMPNKS